MPERLRRDLFVGWRRETESPPDVEAVRPPVGRDDGHGRCNLGTKLRSLMTARIRVVEEVCARCVHELLDRAPTTYGIDIDSRIRRRRDSELESSNRRQWSRGR